MSWELLPEDFTDAIWVGLKKYQQVNNDDGTVSFEDVTVYQNKEKSFFGAKEANRIDEAVNYILAALEGGTDLYEGFKAFADAQKDILYDFIIEKCEETEEIIRPTYMAEVDAFLDEIKGKLSEDIAGSLQVQIEDLRTSVGTDYREDTSYVSGDYAFHDGKLYKCLDATTGVWDSSKWEKVNVLDELSTIIRDNVEPLNERVTVLEENLSVATIRVTYHSRQMGYLIHCKSGELDFTKMATSGGVVEFKVGKGEWTIYSELQEDESVHIIVDQFVTYSGVLPSVEVVSWQNGTDEEIVAMLDAHYAGTLIITEYWAVGQERVLTNNLGTLVIMDVEKYELAEPLGGKCAYVVGWKDCVNSMGMHNSNTNKGGWEKCDIREWLNGTYWNGLPESLKNIFKMHKRTAGIGGNVYSGLTTTTDYLSLPTEKEIFGSRIGSYEDEAKEYTQLEYYKISGNRIKNYNGSVVGWYLSSTVERNDYRFVGVATNGGNTQENAVVARGVAPIGCI